MIKNKELVDEGFDCMLPSLAEFVQKKMVGFYKDDWKKNMESVPDPRHAPWADDYKFTKHLDAACCLKTIDKKWQNVFKAKDDEKDNNTIRGCAIMLVFWRNVVSHKGQDDLGRGDAICALETMWLFCRDLEFECADEIKKMCDKVNEVEPSMCAIPVVRDVSDGGDDIAVPVPTKPASTTQDMYRRFWESFEKILNERGNPFIVTPRTRKSGNGETIYDGSALVCSDKPGGDVCLSVEFRPSPRMGLIRVSIIVGKASHKCFENLKGHRKEIDNMLKRNHRWDDKGMCGAGRSRIKTEIKIDPYDTDGYDGYVGETILIIKRYIGVCRKYLPKAVPLTK